MRRFITEINGAFFLALGALGWLCSCSTTGSHTQLDAKTDAILAAMSDKLATAKSLRVTFTRKSSPGFHAGVNIAESSSGVIVVQRPDRLVATMNTNAGKRTVGLADGKVTLVDHTAGTHAGVKASGDIDRTLRSIEENYGIMLPVAELLVNHPRAFLLDGVKTARCLGAENIAGVSCDHLAFTQDGLSWDLWVAVGDKLPRRMHVTYPNGEGGAPLTMTADISKWELGVPLSAADLALSIPAGSRAIEMIPLN
jgi:hypothetical protein